MVHIAGTHRHFTYSEFKSTVAAPDTRTKLKGDLSI